jgi:hypothetical protein
MGSSRSLPTATPPAMPFSVSSHTLLKHVKDLSDGSVLVTPLSHKWIRITDVQEQRIDEFTLLSTGTDYQIETASE